MIRPTSRTAFQALIDSGELTRLERQVMLAINELPTVNVTRREIAEYLHNQASTVAGAVNRLIKQGILPTPIQDKECSVTGRLSEAITFRAEAARIPVVQAEPAVKYEHAAVGCHGCVFDEDGRCGGERLVAAQEAGQLPAPQYKAFSCGATANWGYVRTV